LGESNIFVDSNAAMILVAIQRFEQNRERQRKEKDIPESGTFGTWTDLNRYFPFPFLSVEFFCSLASIVLGRRRKEIRGCLSWVSRALLAHYSHLFRVFEMLILGHFLFGSLLSETETLPEQKVNL
jgi:hypothetical protein